MAEQAARNMFVNRESGAICRVTHVDSSYATVEVIWPAPGKYSMPVKDYDGGTFAEQWRPATAEDIRPTEGDGFRFPHRIAEDWGMAKEAIDLGLEVITAE